MRAATDDDRAAVLAHLRAHEATSMFALVNLAGRGVAMRVWVAPGGMVGVTDEGMVLPQWPGGDWTAAAQALAGVRVTGLLGPADQVGPLRGALGLGEARVRHAGEEPGYRLMLGDLRLPDCAGWMLEPVTEAVAGTVRGWRADYERELFAMPPAEAAGKAERDVRRWQVADSHRVLWQGGVPVALTGFNAVLPDVVQVGAVYVPPALRGRGHARRAVGLHLAQARSAGVQRAVLFAASDPAARAYEALGFRAAGRMGLVLFEAPQVVA